MASETLASTAANDLLTALEEGGAEPISRWLERDVTRRPEDKICHRNNIRVFFPVPTLEAEDAFEKLLTTVTRLFQGATTYLGEGVGCDDAACTRLVRERVKILEVAHSCTSFKERNELLQALKAAEVETGQTFVGVEANGTFYGIETSKMRVPRSIRR